MLALFDRMTLRHSVAEVLDDAIGYIKLISMSPLTGYYANINTTLQRGIQTDRTVELSYVKCRHLSHSLKV